MIKLSQTQKIMLHLLNGPAYVAEIVKASGVESKYVSARLQQLSLHEYAYRHDMSNHNKIQWKLTTRGEEEARKLKKELQDHPERHKHVHLRLIYSN